jgi:hypothetical protein
MQAVANGEKLGVKIELEINPSLAALPVGEVNVEQQEAGVRVQITRPSKSNSGNPRPSSTARGGSRR